jgi:hypothetical protein
MRRPYSPTGLSLLGAISREHPAASASTNAQPRHDRNHRRILPVDADRFAAPVPAPARGGRVHRACCGAEKHSARAGVRDVFVPRLLRRVSVLLRLGNGVVLNAAATPGIVVRAGTLSRCACSETRRHGPATEASEGSRCSRGAASQRLR